jgi:DNA-directed RNA polymerase specialized sigma24 family protein
MTRDLHARTEGRVVPLGCQASRSHRCKCSRFRFPAAWRPVVFWQSMLPASDRFSLMDDESLVLTLLSDAKEAKAEAHVGIELQRRFYDLVSRAIAKGLPTDYSQTIEASNSATRNAESCRTRKEVDPAYPVTEMADAVFVWLFNKGAAEFKKCRDRDARSKFRPWLYRCTRNKAADHFRALKGFSFDSIDRDLPNSGDSSDVRRKVEDQIYAPEKLETDRVQTERVQVEKLDRRKRLMEEGYGAEGLERVLELEDEILQLQGRADEMGRAYNRIYSGLGALRECLQGLHKEFPDQFRVIHLSCALCLPSEDVARLCSSSARQVNVSNVNVLKSRGLDRVRNCLGRKGYSDIEFNRTRKARQSCITCCS